MTLYRSTTRCQGRLLTNRSVIISHNSLEYVEYLPVINLHVVGSVWLCGRRLIVNNDVLKENRLSDPSSMEFLIQNSSNLFHMHPYISYSHGWQDNAEIHPIHPFESSYLACFTGSLSLRYDTRSLHRIPNFIPLLRCDWTTADHFTESFGSNQTHISLVVGSCCAIEAPFVQLVHTAS